MLRFLHVGDSQREENAGNELAAAVDRKRALLREEREEIVLDREAEPLLELSTLRLEVGEALVRRLEQAVEVVLEVAERDVENGPSRQVVDELGRVVAQLERRFALVSGIDGNPFVLGRRGKRDELECPERFREGLEALGVRVGGLAIDERVEALAAQVA